MSVPATFIEWELALTDRFLRVQGDGDRMPIRSFEVSTATLVTACHDDAVSAEEVKASFISAFSDRRDLSRALTQGLFTDLTQHGAPGFFSYLALTLFVENALEDDSGGVGQFRVRLAAHLDTTSTFNNLAGVEEMWVTLVKWLERQASTDPSFRTLALPERPENWNNIGYTKRLCFPRKKDLKDGAGVLQGRPDLLDRSSDLINAFDQIVSRKGVSQGLVDAYTSFRTSHFEGNRYLADHPFWTFVRRCVIASIPASTGDFVIEAFLDEDRSITFASRTIADVGDVVTSGSLGDLVSKFGNSASLNTSRRGVLAFAHAGYGRWQTIDDIGRCVGRVLVAVAVNKSHLIGVSVSSWARSGAWLVKVEPVSVSSAEDVFRKFGITVSSDDRIIGIGVGNGIRTTGGWLGRSCCLPSVTYPSDLLTAFVDDKSDLVVIGFRDDEGGYGRMRSDGPVHGTVTIDAVQEQGSKVPFWSRQVAFRRDATPHYALHGPALAYDLLRDLSAELYVGPPLVGGPTSWEDADPTTADLVEAVYAGGRSGWNEIDLVPLVERACNGAANPWSVIGILQDSTVLEPRLRPLWKGCVWTLVAPTLTTFGSGSDSVSFVCGALCRAMEADFRTVVISCGGTPFRHRGVGDFSPSMIGFTGGDVPAIAGRLVWQVSVGERPVTNKAVSASRCSSPMPAYIPSRWDWGASRFVEDSEAAPRNGLVRHRHPTGSSHDIFEVRGGGKSIFSLSRTAAISFAGISCCETMFVIKDGRITGSKPSIRLPHEVARALRGRNLRNPGIVDRCVRYPLGGGDGSLLRKLFTTIIDGDRPLDPEAIDHAALRHAGERFRAAWLNGRLGILPLSATS